MQKTILPELEPGAMWWVRRCWEVYASQASMVLCAFTRLFMTILTVNTGSSSVRLAAFARSDDALTELATVRHDLSAGGDPRVMLSEFRQTHGLSGIDVSVHRVVQGGANLTASRLLDQEVEREIDRLTPLAPLHNPVSLPLDTRNA